MSILHLSDASSKDEVHESIAAARRVLETESAALLKLAAGLNDSFHRAVEMIAGAEGRVVVTGMGKSGHVGKKIAATMSSTGTPAFFVHPAEASHGDMGMIVRGDVVLALSNSGETRELSDLIQYTRRYGIPLISITRAADSTLGSKSDITLLLPNAPEACPNGQAPTTSTTMTMALGDALAIALLERKGFSAKDFHVYHPGGKLGQQLMRVSEIMHTGAQLPVAPQDVTVAEAVRIITEKGFGCVALTDAEGRLAGLITDGDIRRNIASDLTNRLARDVMTKNPKVATTDTLVAEAMAIMNVKNSITMLVVIDADKKPAGLLHLHDCLRAGFA